MPINKDTRKNKLKREVQDRERAVAYNWWEEQITFHRSGAQLNVQSPFQTEEFLFALNNEWLIQIITASPSCMYVHKKISSAPTNTHAQGLLLAKWIEFLPKKEEEIKKNDMKSKVKRRENIEAHDIRSDALFYI